MKPKLTIIINFFNMRREAQRTLYTLSTQYQQGVHATDYQVIALDNGSKSPLDEEFVSKFGNNFKYYFFESDSKSPAAAINFGVRAADSEFIACIIDGARMVSPRMISYSLKAVQMFKHTFVCALAWHLGPKSQKKSMLEGYDQAEEDRLLDSVDWRADGYRLFEISTLAGSSQVGILGGMPNESSYYAMRKAAFLDFGGLDERFQSSGGGLVNNDLQERVVERPEYNHVVLLGEGCFHQIHGGAATGSQPGAHPMREYEEEYQRIRKKPHVRFQQPHVHYLGAMPSAAKKFLNATVQNSELSQKLRKKIRRRSIKRFFRKILLIP